MMMTVQFMPRAPAGHLPSTPVQKQSQGKTSHKESKSQGLESTPDM